MNSQNIRIWDEESRRRATAAVSTVPISPPTVVSISPEKRTRSKGANARYWVAILEQIAEQVVQNGRKFSKETWHEYYAGLFLPWHDVVWPNGKVTTERGSTAELGPREFDEYLLRVQADAVLSFGVRFDEEL